MSTSELNVLAVFASASLADGSTAPGAWRRKAFPAGPARVRNTTRDINKSTCFTPVSRARTSRAVTLPRSFESSATPLLRRCLCVSGGNCSLAEHQCFLAHLCGSIQGQVSPHAHLHGPDHQYFSFSEQPCVSLRNASVRALHHRNCSARCRWASTREQLG